MAYNKEKHSQFLVELTFRFIIRSISFLNPYRLAMEIAIVEMMQSANEFIGSKEMENLRSSV